MKNIITGMGLALIALTIILIGCNANEEPDTIAKTDTLKTAIPTTAAEQILPSKDTLPVTKTYSNKRFKDVIATRISKDSFLIRGRGQIFEANFSWVIEDGHNELRKGFEMTDAGAPEWGKFKFIVQAKKQRMNSTLTLILFEASAMDGSRQYELPIRLY